MSDYNKVICFDTETTGTSNSDEVLSVSIVNGNSEVLFDELVKPINHSSWKGAERVNHISPDMVADKKTLNQYQDELIKIIDYADVLIGYNLEFDIRLMMQSGMSKELFYKNKKHYDVMKLFSEMLHINKAKSLIKCAEYFKYDWKGKAHTSIADALATMYCYNKLYSYYLEQ